MEANNMKAMFEALADITLLTIKVGRLIRADVACGIIASKAKHALKTPPRNCDVGTAEEQIFRHKEYCKRHTTGAGCSQCPLVNSLDCRFVWEQMPYEEGGNNANE